MSWIGHPLAGDELYGGRTFTDLKRQALHAYKLSFIHPITEEPLSFQSPYPKDIQLFLSKLKDTHLL